MSGYVRIHRTLFGHPAFRNESETMAFAWLIGKAAWRDTRVRYKNHAISLKRGQLAISVRDMAAAFDRDKAWITRLLNRLISEAMIETHAETGVTVVTICNYSQYQGDDEKRETPRRTAGETRGETDARQTRDTEQRREEVKKEIAKPHVRTLTREPSLPADLQAVMNEAKLASPPDRRILTGWYDLAREMFDQEPEATLRLIILPTIRKVMAREQGKRPASLKYFDAAIREKLAEDQREVEHFRRVAARYSSEGVQ